MTRYSVIVNPTSGRGEGGFNIPKAKQLLSALGVTFDLARTERPMHAVELARRAAGEGYDVVVSMGGDGTANEVLNGLMQAKLAGEGEAAMGIITVGRGNDFGHGIDVPRGLEPSCRILAAGKRKRMDVGKVTGGLFPQGRYFGNGIGIGFDTIVGFEAAKLTWLSGFPSYLAAALKTIFLYFRAPLLRITHDGGTIEQPALMVSVMNGRRMGGSFHMAPQSKNDDGKFTVCLAGQVSRAGIFLLIPRFIQGTQAGHPAIRYLETSKLEVEALSGTIAAHADGETLSTDAPRMSAEIFPRAIDVIVGG
ncbi:MAG: diacylglycerol kinase family lipid kinase [Anaerolineales bacterium]|nr:diacylglycerol kinase family lipid kinase [Anaerolineales bacterium]